MAEGGKPKRIKMVLECSVCRLNFNKTDKLPKVLTCGHTICEYCLSKLRNRTKISCPLCREIGRVTGAKTNYTVLDMLESMCEDCCEREHELPCSHCKKNFCQTCHENHLDMLYTEFSHDLQSLDDEVKRTRDMVAYCNDEEMILYEKNKATTELQKMKAQVQEERELLDKKEKDLEESIVKLREDNIQSILKWKKTLDECVTTGTAFLNQAKNKQLNKTSDQENKIDIQDLKTRCRTILQAVQNARQTYVVPYHYQPQSLGETGGQVVVSITQKKDIMSINYKKLSARKTIGQKGMGINGFDEPWGLTVSSKGHIVVTDSENNRVKIFDRHMNLKIIFEDDQNLGGPTGVAISHKNEIFIICWDTGKICVCSIDGKSKGLFGISDSEDDELFNPMGAAFGPDGLLYVCDGLRDRIAVYREDGTHVRYIGSGGATPGCFKDKPNQVLITSDNNEVLIAEWNRSVISVFKPNGEFIKYLPKKWPEEMKDADLHGMAIDRSGNLLVCDRKNSCLHVINMYGNYVCSYGSKGKLPGMFEAPMDVVVNAEDQVIVCDSDNHRLQILEFPAE